MYGTTNIKFIGILVRATHSAPDDGPSPVAASSIIPEMKLSLFLTDGRYDLRKI
jgi:hypothetical protein